MAYKWGLLTTYIHWEPILQVPGTTPRPSPVRFSEMIFSGEAAAVDFFFGAGVGTVGSHQESSVWMGVHLGSGWVKGVKVTISN